MTQPVGILSPFDRTDQKLMRIIFAMLVCVLCLVGLHQLRGGPVGPVQDRPILRENTVYLLGDQRSGTTIKNASQTEQTYLAPGEGKFLETLVTVINFNRTRSGADLAAPITVRVHSAQRVTIFDPATGEIYNMASYGQDNIAHLITYLVPEQQG